LVLTLLWCNKSNFKEHEVTMAELAKSFECKFFEVSAKTSINMEHSFVCEIHWSKPANQDTRGNRKSNQAETEG
jgi:hypothetical protein